MHKCKSGTSFMEEVDKFHITTSFISTYTFWSSGATTTDTGMEDERMCSREQGHKAAGEDTTAAAAGKSHTAAAGS